MKLSKVIDEITKDNILDLKQLITMLFNEKVADEFHKRLKDT